VSATPHVDARTQQRWLREAERCETRQQMALTWECHRLEMYIIQNWGRR
jgi:hypothetical protein